MRWSLLLFCALCSSALAQVQPTSTILTKGSLLFNEKGVTFHTKEKDYQYPFPKVETFGPKQGPLTPQVPGLMLQSERQQMITNANGVEKDVSQLIFTASDRSSIELKRGEPLEVYRIEITFSDQRQIILWQPASKVK